MKAIDKQITTVKSNTEPGEVSFRPIHALRDYAYAGLALWLVSKLKQMETVSPALM